MNEVYCEFCEARIVDPDDPDVVTDNTFKFCHQECHNEWLEDGRVFEDDFHIDFAYPGGFSALRAATDDNPRDQPCPTCKRENVLTPADVAQSYQCDRCAEGEERGF